MVVPALPEQWVAKVAEKPSKIQVQRITHCGQFIVLLIIAAAEHVGY